MQESRQKNKRIRTGKKAAIWISVVAALGMHVLFLFLPVSLHSTRHNDDVRLIELQLTKRPEPPLLADIPAIPEPEPFPEPEIAPSSVEKVAEAPPEPEQPEPAPDASQAFKPYARTGFEDMSDAEKLRVTSSILTQQFLREKPLAEQLFGRPLTSAESDHIAEFHYPVRASMISMLNPPMPDLPFAYQENLVNFAYDPGVRGDLQKFWDVITPEFGWRTRYGTEVRCIWVLVIAACGWK